MSAHELRVGTHGYSGIDRLLGTTSTRRVRPGDASERARDVAVTMAMAEKLGAQLTLLHASWLPPVDGRNGKGLDWHPYEMTEAGKKELTAKRAQPWGG